MVRGMKKSDRSSPDQKELDRATAQMATRIASLMKERNWRVSDLVRASPVIEPHTVPSWLGAHRLPQPVHLMALSGAFRICVEDLVDGVKLPTTFREKLEWLVAAARRRPR